MKKIQLFVALICYILSFFTMEAKRIDVEKAEKVARSYARTTVRLTERRDFKLTKTVSRQIVRKRTDKQSITSQQQQNEPMFYVFTMNGNGGFVIISGDDIAKPILGYSDNGTYDENNPNLAYWMETLSQEIADAVENGIAQDEQTKAEWEAFESESKATAAASGGDFVDPLITTRWDQEAPYNNLCPQISRTRTATGCVATTMAQIMRFHRYPTTRTKTIPGYTTQTKRITVPAIAGTFTYKWDDMTDIYTSSSSKASQDAVAELIYHCGVGVQMDYGLASDNGSGASSSDVAPALKDYFGYDAGIAHHYREYYTYSEWTNMLKTEIKAGRPVYYSGSNNDSGHAFVCDGYDAGGLFHFNWGWSGSSDGYFEISALNPNSTGTGGSSKGYNQLQEIVTGIQPDKGGEAIVQLYLSKFYANKTLLNSLSETFDITMEELGNIGSATINNLYLGILINTQGNEYYSRYTENVDLDLPPNYRYSYIPLEQYNLPSGLSAGTYKLYPMFSASQYGNPTIISSDNGKPYITVTVQSDGKVTLSSDNSKKPNLWLESLQSTGELYQDVSGDFKVEIYNAGTVDYNSNISLQLGSQTIATKKVKVAAGYTETFDLSGKITLSPGNYSLSVKYDPNNTSTATPSELLGSSMIVTVNETPQYAPDAPTLAGKTAASITLNALDGDVEYSKDGVNWQDSPIFDGLAPNTGYTFYARYKGSTVLSKPSKTFTTDKAALSGAVTISGTAKVGETLTAEVSTLESEPKIANLGTISYQWKRNGTDISGATGSAYTLMPADIASAITVTVSTDETQGYLTSDATATVELSNLSVNGISISIVDSQLDYQATCDETSITVSVGLPVAASTTLTATADGVEYSSGKNIPLSKEKEVTEINISISSVDGTTSNEYKLSVANVLEANNILFKRWDDVVAVNRNPANNGGYRNIDGVRWYIANATVSEEWHIQTTGEYSVEISIANRWHQVCGSPEVRSSRLIAYPNPVSTGENLTLQLPKNFTGGYLDVISLTGSTVKQKMPLPDIFKTISVADWAPGIYLLNVVAPDGDREIIKIVVGN